MNLTNLIAIVGKTDTGLVRKHNEDAIGAEITQGLVVLADGMGAYKSGEIASEMAVSTVLQEFKDKYEAQNVNTKSAIRQNLLRESIELANRLIRESSLTKEEHRGMGTTIVSALFYDNKVIIAHVGDSRLYRLRNRKLESITADHSLIQELIEKGFYTPEEARSSKSENIITRALGIESNMQVDIQEQAVFEKDLYILCSDGLNDMVEDKDIETLLNTFFDDTEKAVDALIDAAKKNGGRDNVSVIGIKINKPFPIKITWANKFSEWF